MTRVKRGFVARKRRKRILKLTKGFRGSHSVLYRTAQQRTLKSLSLSYRDRRQFKREVRKLWIRRINSGIRLISRVQRSESKHSTPKNYSSFIHGLKKSNIELNRKVLSQFAIFDPFSFQNILENSNSI
jgi:large subunit ribosomal protein L20